jgi:hypothetical protein
LADRESLAGMDKCEVEGERLHKSKLYAEGILVVVFSNIEDRD